MNTKANNQLFNTVLMVLSFVMVSPLRATDLSLADSPLFLTSVAPNVMVMLDNSGSMKVQMYPSAYDNSKDYSGMFEATINYIYDRTIPVNTGAYLVTVNSGDTGAFVESNCSPSIVDVSCWSGRYLNWLTTKRIDSSRVVLVGGKLESETAFNYGTNLNYKIVGNNEYADQKFTEVDANSASYSPIPNNVAAVVDSPARINGGSMQALYSPYAKIFASGAGGGKLYNSAGSEIGEFGAADVNGAVDGSGNLTDASWVTVTFQVSYASIPAVVANPPTFNGADPGIARIRNVTTSSFQINMQEWEYKDGNHTTETINYMVLKKGHHTLPGGLEIDADSVVTSDEYAGYDSGTVTQSQSVSFNSSLSSPLVIASVTTYGSDTTAVLARVRGISNSGFKVALQEEEDLGGHGNETVSYIAIEQGSVTDTSNTPNWSLQSDKGNNVDENRETITFASAFSGKPFVIAGMQDISGVDPASIRLDSTSNTGFEIHVEEEKSADNDVGHSNEDIGYIALEGISADFNVALVVQNKPTGLLQDIESKVRLGISFYRYDPNVNDIYNGNTIPGGTMKFKIPLNPFVKKPTNTSLPSAERGYRATDLTGYVGPTSMADISDAIQHYPLVWGSTPLAENLWEVIQYFEQDDPHYADVVSGFKDFDKADTSNPERDPYYYSNYGKKLECAKSSVIVFTDGFPYKDADVPDSVRDYDEDNHVDDVTDTNPNVQGKDNLDDVAYWGYCNKASGACTTVTGGSRDLRSDIDNLTDVDGSIISQFLKVYTVGFADGTIRPVLQDTADNAGGEAYAAEDGLTLKTALEEAFTAAIDDSSASAVAVTTGSITSKTAVFQARFNSNDWTGELLAFPVNSDGSLGAEVSASNVQAAGSRIIVSYNGTQGIPFQWPAVPASPTASELTIAQQALLNNNVNLLNYTRGIDTLEEKNAGVFRNRDTLLGDVIHSSPAFVAATIEQLYPDNWGTLAPENLYPFSTFKATIQALNSAEGRTPVVYVASNDGMVHAFNAKITDTNNDGIPEFPAAFGSEIFAYVPNSTFDKLVGLSNPNYAHQYSVDGSPTIGEAFFNNAWHTMLVGGLRGGGQGIYALDVTNPANYNSEVNASAKVLWEFTDDDDDGDDSDGNVGEKGDNELGYTFSRPNIVRMQNGVWAAVFGNGYNNTVADSSTSSTGNAVLFIVNLETGALIKKIDTGVGVSDAASGGRPNGLSTVAPVDIDGDSIVDFIYGGDLYGNLWKFDVTNSNPNDVSNPWRSSYTVGVSPEVPIPLFTACESSTCTNTNHQPITVRPQVGRKEKAEGYMVYFGTGKYIETTDNTQAGQLTQSFYGVWDKALSTLTSFTRSNLLEQSITLEINQGFDTDNDSSTGVLDPITGLPDPDGFDTFFDLRVTTDDNITSSYLGWYMDLVNTDSSVNPTLNNFGERQVSDPVLRNGRIIFTTLIPSDDPCESGGSGWLMELDAVDGARLPFSPFDLNGDKEFNIEDYVEIDTDNDGEPDLKVPVSGKKSKVGIISAPSVVDDEDKEYKYNSGSSGDIEVTRENPGLDYTGRQSWNLVDF